MEDNQKKDEDFMRRALMEAQAAFDEDEIPVGAVIVCKDRIISRAHNLTEMLTYVVSFILELWHHCGATQNAKHALTACDQMESLERSLLSLLPTNLSGKPSLLLHMRRNI